MCAGLGAVFVGRSVLEHATDWFRSSFERLGDQCKLRLLNSFLEIVGLILCLVSVSSDQSPPLA